MDSDLNQDASKSTKLDKEAHYAYLSDLNAMLEKAKVIDDSCKLKFSKSLNSTALILHAEAHSFYNDAAKRSKVFVGEINSHLEKVNSYVLKFKNYVKGTSQEITKLIKAKSNKRKQIRMTKTRTEKRMKIEVRGDKSQDEVNGKVNSESGDNLNSIDDDGANILVEKSSEIDKGVIERKGSNEEENNHANAQFQHSESGTRDNDSDADSDMVSFRLDSEQAHWTLACIDLLEKFHLKSHLQNIYELTFIKYLGNNS